MSEDLNKINTEFKNLFSKNQVEINKLIEENKEIDQSINKNTNFINNINKLFEKQD